MADALCSCMQDKRGQMPAPTGLAAFSGGEAGEACGVGRPASSVAACRVPPSVSFRRGPGCPGVILRTSADVAQGAVVVVGRRVDPPTQPRPEEDRD